MRVGNTFCVFDFAAVINTDFFHVRGDSGCAMENERNVYEFANSLQTFEVECGRLFKFVCAVACANRDRERITSSFLNEF
ncbi:MAG: hypothetical protein ACD_67C00224G0001, partial [uncultured bacterium]